MAFTKLFMKRLHRHLLALAIFTGSWVNPLSADPEALFGLSITPDRKTICFMPEATGAGVDELPIMSFSDRPGWSQDWRVSLNALRSAFEAQWTDEHYQDSENLAVYEGLPGAWLEDFTNAPILAGNPLTDAERCGRELGTPHSRLGIQVVLLGADTPQLDFRSFPLDTPFAVKLYGAEWVHPWDDAPGLHQRSLPNGWVLRRKTSQANLNEIRLTASGSRTFVVAVQGPGINSGDTSQYGSLTVLYYVPKPGQVLSQFDRRRSLLSKILLKKLQPLPLIFAADHLPPNLNTLLTALSPRRELCATFPEFGRICFSETPIRKSWLYQHIGGRPFFEAVYVHSYTHFRPYGSLLLANLIWDEKAKGEALQQKCSEYFNVDALPQELRDFLLAPNAPFAKLRFQINMQYYMLGKEPKDDKKDDPTQILRPHYAVANMLFPEGRRPADLVNGTFAMRLWGASFTNPDSEGGTSHFPHRLPQGFSSRSVHIHEGIHIHEGTEKVVHHFWLASPNNCQIAGTENHKKGRSFYSVVMGKCMQYRDAYSDNRPWDNDVTAIVTLHILLPVATRVGSLKLITTGKTVGYGITFASGSSVDILKDTPLSSVAKVLYQAWETTDNDENLFQAFYDLFSLSAN
jgi:hypothetical protein